MSRGDINLHMKSLYDSDVGCNTFLIEMALESYYI